MNIKNLFLYLLTIIVISPVLAQKATFKGKVFDAKSKEALIGVNVVVKGGRGAATTPNGTFEIKLDPGTYDVTVSFLGYKTESFSITLDANEVIEKDIALEQEGKLMKMT